MRTDLTPRKDRKNLLEPRPPIPFTSHIGRLSRLYPDISLPTRKIQVQLKGMKSSKNITLGKSQSLNSQYMTSSHTVLDVYDTNDKSFFVIKAIKNPELYRINSPAGLVKQVNAVRLGTNPVDDSDQIPADNTPVGDSTPSESFDTPKSDLPE